MKSRNLDIDQFLTVLQKEYLLAELRTKIYTKPRDKKYHSCIMMYKKTKIEDICRRYNLISIFTDKQLYYKLYREVIPCTGYPQWMYRDEVQRKRMEEQDKDYFFCVGVPVLGIKGERVVGGVIEKKLDNGNFLVEGEEFSPEEITRVL